MLRLCFMIGAGRSPAPWRLPWLQSVVVVVASSSQLLMSCGDGQWPGPTPATGGARAVRTSSGHSTLGSPEGPRIGFVSAPSLEGSFGAPIVGNALTCDEVGRGSDAPPYLSERQGPFNPDVVEIAVTKNRFVPFMFVVRIEGGSSVAYPVRHTGEIPGAYQQALKYATNVMANTQHPKVVMTKEPIAS